MYEEKEMMLMKDGYFSEVSAQMANMRRGMRLGGDGERGFYKMKGEVCM